MGQVMPRSSLPALVLVAAFPGTGAAAADQVAPFQLSINPFNCAEPDGPNAPIAVHATAVAQETAPSEDAAPPG